MIKLHRAKRSVIIEDLFGLDQQFLKGHEYVLNIDDTEKSIELRGTNYIQYLPKQGYFLSRKDVEENFEILKPEYIIAGKGNPKLLGFTIREEK